MRKLTEVEEAKALMTEAISWSVMKWMKEKKRVRSVADQANAALDELDRSVKASWNHEKKTAYDELAQAGAGFGNKESAAISPDIRQFARQVKEADDEARRARMDAENTFDQAERMLSTSMAREGCQKAIRSWDLHEKAIRQAET